MRKLALILISLSLAAALAADSLTQVVTSAASPSMGITADCLASVFGNSISTQTIAAGSPPWPTSLGDITGVTITDSKNQQQQAGILFVSQSQMNIYVPPGFAAGPATVAFPVTGLGPGVGTAALRIANVNIQKVAPALFSANGTGVGVAAATAIRIAIPTQMQSPVPVVNCSSATACSAVPIDPGLDTPVYISLYGTGIRGASSLANVSVTIGNVTAGNVTAQPTYAGPQGQTPGLDQVNFPLSLNLRGAGLVNVTVTVDGTTSNAVQLAIQ